MEGAEASASAEVSHDRGSHTGQKHQEKQCGDSSGSLSSLFLRNSKETSLLLHIGKRICSEKIHTKLFRHEVSKLILSDLKLC